jgi:hypothetical protein
MCIEGSNRAIPWKMDYYESFPWEDEKKDREAFEAEVNTAVKMSIDRNVPVHYGSEEDGLIIRIRKGRQPLMVPASLSQAGKESILAR